jgi:hypothetical protein
MKPLREILDNSTDEKEYILTFSSGNVLSLKNFEGVDYSIYERDDLYVAWVVSQITCDKRFFTPGTGFQFSLSEVRRVVSKDTGEVLYEAHGGTEGVSL